MRMNRYLFVTLILVAWLGTVYTAQAFGIWSVSGKLDKLGNPITATGQNPDEIKGWMKIGDVTAAYKIPWEEIQAAFEIPKDLPPSTALKDIEKVAPKFSVSELRAWIAEWMIKHSSK